jgi:predicted membrane-bound spermidine synthase
MWLLTAMAAGAVMMALELVAFRLYAPYFGYSIYVWGSMISVVMAALSVGYALGGKIADKSSSDVTLYLLILGSGLYQLLTLLTHHLYLAKLALSGDFIGSVVATLIIFAPCMLALAMVSPFVIRLLARSGHVGTIAGMVYGVSTVGSIGGVLMVSFFLLPCFGTHATLKILCASSLLVGLLGLVSGRSGAMKVLVPLPTLLFAPVSLLRERHWSADTVWAADSPYNLVRVLAHEGQLALVLNNSDLLQTVRKQKTVWTGYVFDDFALGPVLRPATRALVLGMGAGASIRCLRTADPGMEIDAVEIDPKVVEVAIQWFGLDPRDPRLHIYVADARRWLTRTTTLYGLVQVDVYQGGPYVPFYLATEEFFRLVLSRLSAEGLLMMNVLDFSHGDTVLLRIVATLKRVFPSVLVRSRFGGNHMVFAFPYLCSLNSVRKQLSEVVVAGDLRDLADRAAAVMVDPAVPSDTPVFTDDLAPVEKVTRRMLAPRGRRKTPIWKLD